MQRTISFKNNLQSNLLSIKKKKPLFWPIALTIALQTICSTSSEYE